jgi:hypothetical protein
MNMPASPPSAGEKKFKKLKREKFLLDYKKKFLKRTSLD